ncbi:MAG TPA: dephospho-CoA kinase [Acidimicrobiales bacterium]|jgi:dephospho-CoA kinase|nr:dephospho-CoA kinase [Acidimicrobiales bacterium]
MLLVGLTGGIGSGKSTVAAGLSGRGAAVVDADAISRQIMEPDGLAFGPVVERFGPGIVGNDGRIDRPAVAALVFNDPDALAALNSITHPLIGQVMAERMQEAMAAAAIVVLDIPLLNIATKDRFTFGAIVVVDTPEDLAVDRLVGQRSFTEADARARIAAQMGRAERRELADLVLDNSGDRPALEAEIDRAWAWLTAREKETGSVAAVEPAPDTAPASTTEPAPDAAPASTTEPG